MKIAVVTGASSNLGKEFILEIAEHFSQIQQIWLIGRKIERLTELKKFIHNKKIKIILLDLALDESYNKYKILLYKYKPRIKLLVNCASVGENIINFDKSTYNQQMDILNLNCKSLIAITKLSIPYMYSGSCIINISSIAAFLPLPKMAVYSATKLFILNFSRALNRELKPKGIKVTVVCPQPSGIYNLYYNQKQYKALGKLAVSNYNKTAELAIKSCIKGKEMLIQGTIFKLLAAGIKVVPHSLILKLYE